MKKYFNKEKILKYSVDAIKGRLLGFFVAMWASKLVSHFFATKSFRNLWGVRSSDKMVVSKEAYENLEWIASVLVGFLVFEIFEKVVMEQYKSRAPGIKAKVSTYMESQGYEPNLKGGLALSSDKAKLVRSKSYELYRSRFRQEQDK